MQNRLPFHLRVGDSVMSRPLAMLTLLLSVTVSYARETKPPHDGDKDGKTGVKRSGRSSTGKANSGAGVTDRAKPRAKTKKPNATRRTVLVESTSWNVEADRVTRGPGGDLQWKRIEKRGLFLIPANDARLRLLSTSLNEELRGNLVEPSLTCQIPHRPHLSNSFAAGNGGGSKNFSGTLRQAPSCRLSEGQGSCKQTP